MSNLWVMITQVVDHHTPFGPPFLVIALVLQLCYDNYKNYAVAFENKGTSLDRLRDTCPKLVQTPLCKLFFHYQGAGSFV